MMRGPVKLDCQQLLDALPDVAFVVTPVSNVLFRNRAAALRFPYLHIGKSFTCLASEESTPDFLTLLERCSGLRQSLAGTVVLGQLDGSAGRFRCTGSLIEPRSACRPSQILLRLEDAEDERFSVLAQIIRRLNAEISERRLVQASLEEAVRQRELLLRELHHRVKNSIQMLVGMVYVAQRESLLPEVKKVLAEAGRRLDAVAAVHQLFYRTDDLERLAADELVSELSLAILRSYGIEHRLDLSAMCRATIPNDSAMPIALILNELLTNAAKYSAPEGRIRILLTTDAGKVALTVEDDGPGFEPTAVSRRASGLGLVRSLVRQLGGQFYVERGERQGARCTIVF